VLVITVVRVDVHIITKKIGNPTWPMLGVLIFPKLREVMPYAGGWALVGSGQWVPAGRAYKAFRHLLLFCSSSEFDFL